MHPVTPVLPSHPYLLGPIYAEHQPQYRNLPCLRGPGPEWKVTTRWHMGFWDRLRVLLTGDIWLQVMPFGGEHPAKLQPVVLLADEPALESCG